MQRFSLPTPLTYTTAQRHAPPHKITNMRIPTILAEPQQRRVEVKEIIFILATRPFTFQDMFGQSIRILRAQKLRILWKANVY
jgi:hypothetical protein